MAGLSNGQIGKAFKRNKGLNHHTIEKLLHAFPDLKRDWFLYGDSDVRLDVRAGVRTEANLQVNEPNTGYKTRAELEAEIERLKAANSALIDAFKAIGEGKSGGGSDVGRKGQKQA